MPSPPTEPHARLLIRIPASLKAKISELARQEHRSLNRQIEFLLDRAIEKETNNKTRDLTPLKHASRRHT